MRKQVPIVTITILLVPIVLVLMAAYSLHQDSRPLREATSNDWSRAASYAAEGLNARERGDLDAAQAYWEKSLVLWQELDYKPGVRSSLQDLGILARERNDLVTAQSLLEEHLALRRELGDPSGIANALYHLAQVAAAQGEDEAAQALFQECLTIRQTYEGFPGIVKVAETLIHLAVLAGRRQDWTTAEGFLEEALTSCQWWEEDRHIRAQCLAGLAQVARAQGQSERAARLLEEAQALSGSVTAPDLLSLPSPSSSGATEALDDLIDEEGWSPEER